MPVYRQPEGEPISQVQVDELSRTLMKHDISMEELLALLEKHPNAVLQEVHNMRNAFHVRAASIAFQKELEVFDEELNALKQFIDKFGIPCGERNIPQRDVAQAFRNVSFTAQDLEALIKGFKLKMNTFNGGYGYSGGDVFTKVALIHTKDRHRLLFGFTNERELVVNLSSEQEKHFPTVAKVRPFSGLR